MIPRLGENAFTRMADRSEMRFKSGLSYYSISLLPDMCVPQLATKTSRFSHWIGHGNI